jgi:hypothetical protein
MKPVTIPADLLPENDPGLCDVTEDTLEDPAKVADFREYLRKRDRNGSRRPRSTPDPEAA